VAWFNKLSPFNPTKVSMHFSFAVYFARHFFAAMVCGRARRITLLRSRPRSPVGPPSVQAQAAAEARAAKTGKGLFMPVLQP
jgi:hypothetical protein